MIASIKLAMIAKNAIHFPFSITSSFLDIPFEAKGKQVSERWRRALLFRERNGQAKTNSASNMKKFLWF